MESHKKSGDDRGQISAANLLGVAAAEVVIPYYVFT